ncbi:hypothetical protein BJX99DRAFT_254010 [Aspergillus californicus]
MTGGKNVRKVLDDLKGPQGRRTSKLLAPIKTFAKKLEEKIPSSSKVLKPTHDLIARPPGFRDRAELESIFKEAADTGCDDTYKVVAPELFERYRVLGSTIVDDGPHRAYRKFVLDVIGKALESAVQKQHHYIAQDMVLQCRQLPVNLDKEMIKHAIVVCIEEKDYDTLSVVLQKKLGHSELRKVFACLAKKGDPETLSVVLQCLKKADKAHERAEARKRGLDEDSRAILDKIEMQRVILILRCLAHAIVRDNKGIIDLVLPLYLADLANYPAVPWNKREHAKETDRLLQMRDHERGIEREDYELLKAALLDAFITSRLRTPLDLATCRSEPPELLAFVLRCMKEAHEAHMEKSRVVFHGCSNPRDIRVVIEQHRVKLITHCLAHAMWNGNELIVRRVFSLYLDVLVNHPGFASDHNGHRTVVQDTVKDEGVNLSQFFVEDVTAFMIHKREQQESRRKPVGPEGLDSLLKYRHKSYDRANHIARLEY